MTSVSQPADTLDLKSILPIIVIVFVDLLGLSIIIPQLPLYAASFSATPLVIGLLQATYPLMQFLGAPILGRLSDRYGRKPVLVISQLGTLAGFILLGFANTLFLLFLSRIIDGLSGANISTAQAAISDSTNERTRTQGLGLIGAAFGMGFILGPVIAFIVLAATGIVETGVEAAVDAANDEDDAWPVVRNLVAFLVAMWIGAWVSRGFAALGMTLPAYIGAMLVAAAIRNLDDVTGWFGLSYRFVNTFGIVSLTLFLVMALMTLKIWELAGLVLPLVAILAVQVVLAALVAGPYSGWWAATTRPR